MSKVHENDKISTQRLFNSTVSRETYKHGRHTFLPRALPPRAHARANDMNYRGTVRTPTCNRKYSFSSEQRQHFLLSYSKTLSVGPVGVSNSRPPASQPGAQPSELPVRGCKYQFTNTTNHRFLTTQNAHSN